MVPANATRTSEKTFREMIRLFGLLEKVMQPYFARFGISGWRTWGPGLVELICRPLLHPNERMTTSRTARTPIAAWVSSTVTVKVCSRPSPSWSISGKTMRKKGLPGAARREGSLR